MDGTNSSNDVVRVLNARLPGSLYRAVFIPGADATAAEAAAFRANVVASINAGYGVVVNGLGPLFSTTGERYDYGSLAFGGGHYVAVTGYTNDGAEFHVDDVNVGEYRVTAGNLATWCAARGYSFSAVSVAPAPPATDMVLYGYDGSDFTNVRNFSGLSFVTHKITEAVSPSEIYTHGQCGSVLSAARDQGVPFIGAYVVPRSGGYSPAEEADVAIRELGRQAPWALEHPGFFWQSDLEKWPYDAVPAIEGVGLLAALRAKTGRAVKSGLLYASKGQYGNTIPGDDNLWNANYPSQASADFTTMYSRAGDAGWSVYSGRMPLIWQYTSAAIFADGNRGDANAFRGTLEDFRRIIIGGEALPPVSADMPIETAFLLLTSGSRE
jgi:hypothetical protein